jgi:DNA (cytosine-5)-methyltransferase 1
MRVLDLFSGIGGFSLGLEKVGMMTVAFCEIDKDAQRVLRKHWPSVPIFDDVKDNGLKNLKRVDVICGGFPCQDISEANTNGKALEGARSGLWFEYLKLIKELRPKYAIIENVQMLRTRGLDTILKNLDAIGYDAEWHCIQASSVGAPHRRDRLWIVAYPHGVRRNPILSGDVISCKEKIVKEGAKNRTWNSLEWYQRDSPSACISQYEQRFGESSLIRMDDGVSKRLDVGRRLKQCGNSIVPEIAELIGEAIMIVEQERIKSSSIKARVVRWFNKIKLLFEKDIVTEAKTPAVVNSTTSNNRWKCDSCGKISASYGITNHQKHTGHVGRTRLSE